MVENGRLKLESLLFPGGVDEDKEEGGDGSKKRKMEKRKK